MADQRAQTAHLPRSHEVEGYRCPFCLFLSELRSSAQPAADSWCRDADLVLQGEQVSAFVCAEQWPRNPGHCLVIPNEHIESLYVLPSPIALQIHEASRGLALAMKLGFGCDGISTRQHNEPAGNQEVWHYHLHVFPRYHGDDLYRSAKARVADEVRAEQARTLRGALRELADAGSIPSLGWVEDSAIPRPG